MDMPVSTRTISSPSEIAMPRERPVIIIFSEMVPSVTSDTCLLSTMTAGSALTMK